MFNRNTSKIGSIALVLVLALAAVGAGLSGSAAAQDSGTVLVDNSAPVDNSTQEAYADVTGVDDMNGTGPVSVNVTFTGLTEGQSVENGTVLLTESVSVSAGGVSSSSYALTDSDRSEYESVHVSVETAGDGSLLASTDWGTLEQISGGGGGLLGGGAGGLSLGALIVVGLVVLSVVGRND